MSSTPDRTCTRGWQAHLALRFQTHDRRTVLVHKQHVGPLIVQRPFYPENPPATGEAAPLAAAPCHTYLIHPPGGVASGDQLSVQVNVERGAHALLTTPAAAKFYRRGAAGRALVSQSLSGAGLIEWLPQENIFYPDADVDLATELHLDGAARCIGWEIGCVGLPARDQALDGGALRLRLGLWHDARPLLLERLHIDAATLAGRWGLGGHVAFGTALAFPAAAAELDAARAALAEALAADDCAERLLACTLIDGVLVCRATARRTDRLRQAFVHWWQAVRPRVLARAAVAPRIWAT